jgi:hypothetical protein
MWSALSDEEQERIAQGELIEELCRAQTIEELLALLAKDAALLKEAISSVVAARQAAATKGVCSSNSFSTKTMSQLYTKL